ncbi:ammonium transporter [Iodidimonas sp. SYSU 1G8]|uniref:ammonium transporter n=1 Tax=Iodidimonas sp. SYSU 1G8 TaxID=3133967 RepID=UPI0031FE996E
MKSTLVAAGSVLAAFCAAAVPAFAQDAPPPTLSAGDTAWMLTATALVLFMTIPGLALFYAGMVRKKNILATLMQSFAICCVMSIVWMVAGYSIAFGDGGGLNAFWGGLDKAFLNHLTLDALSYAVPESVFITFQMTFAIITPALITGAFADRMKFSSMLVFMTLWSLIVYAPVCHWVWGGGFLAGEGVLDYAGGTVVHINAGIAGLVACIVLGKRHGYRQENMAPYNLALALIGASMLWVGWFGFNAGSAVAADFRAGMAMLVTQVATAAAALAWMFVEWIVHKKPSVLGIISGAVAGLVAITPASGFVGPMGALIIGLASGVICFFAATSLKKALGYDDSLDVWGVHGVGGIVGAALTGLFAVEAIGGTAGSIGQVVKQLEGIVATVLWSGIVTFILLKLIDMVMGIRVTKEQEVEGLDVSLHGESLQ